MSETDVLYGSWGVFNIDFKPAERSWQNKFDVYILCSSCDALIT